MEKKRILKLNHESHNDTIKVKEDINVLLLSELALPTPEFIEVTVLHPLQFK